MAQDQTKLYNLALTSLGDRGKVSSPSEKSRGAEMCELWYEPVRDIVLRAAFWPVAKDYALLALSASRDVSLPWAPGDPEPGYLYTYKQPGNILYPRYLTSYAPFVTGINSSDELVIHTNELSPILVFTKQSTNVSTWDATLYMAITAALGAAIALPLTGKRAIAQILARRADEIIMDARAQSANEATIGQDQLPAALVARGFAGAAEETRFIQPFDSLVGSSPAIGGTGVK
jgi:hypothetical protein